jgi:tol-pal system protein YbgF
MKRLRLTLLILLCAVTAPAVAGLFADDDARKQIKQLEAQVAKNNKQIAKLEEANEQQTRSMLDLLTQVEGLNNELRKLRGQNEDFAHNLQDAEKRQKDFYIDLDGRLRRFEAVDDAVANKLTGKAKSDDPVSENRAFEAAYAFYKAERYQNAVTAFGEFTQRFPQSVHSANVYYLMGNANFVLKDFKNSLASYQVLASKYDTHPKIQDAWSNMVDCEIELNDITAAKKTLKQIIIKFPNTDTASKAKKRLAAMK